MPNKKETQNQKDMKLHQLMGLTPSKDTEPIPTGFKELDLLTGGLHIGKICTIAARPGMGKTSFAVSLLRNIGVIQKVPTAFLSLELDEMQIMRWLKDSITGIAENNPYGQKTWTPPQEIVNEFAKRGFHINPERKTVWDAVKMMKAAPVWIEHDLGVSIKEIVSRMERLRQENNVRVVFIDSLQWGSFSGNYTEQSEKILRLLQAAERLKVAVVLTASLNRSVETRGGTHRPELWDLKDYGRLEVYSSTVMLIYRPEYYKQVFFDDECGTLSKGLADIMVEKNTYGNTGIVRLCFDNHNSFRDISCEKEIGIPENNDEDFTLRDCQKWMILPDISENNNEDLPF